MDTNKQEQLAEELTKTWESLDYPDTFAILAGHPEEITVKDFFRNRKPSDAELKLFLYLRMWMRENSDTLGKFRGLNNMTIVYR